MSGRRDPDFAGSVHSTLP